MAFDAANEVHYANNSIPGFIHPTLKLADLCSTIEALTVAVKVVTDSGAVCKFTEDRDVHVSYP